MPDTPYRQFLDRVPDGFLLFDDQGCLLDANIQACSRLGHDKAALLGLRLTDIGLDMSGQPLTALWQDMAVDSQACIAGRLLCSDGSSFPAEIHVYCQSPSGRRLFFATLDDISERVRHDEQICQLNMQLEQRVKESTQLWQDSTRLLAAVMSETPDLVFVKDLQGRYVFVNPAAARFTQRTPEDIVGKTDQELFQDRSNFSDSDRRMLDSNVPVVSDEHLQVGGQHRIFQAIKSPYRDARGNTVGLLGIARDITQIRQTEAQLQKSYDVLRQAEQLARIGSWTLDLETERFQASEMMYVMNGLDPKGPPLTRQAMRDMLSPQDLARLTAAVHLCAATGQSYSIDVVHRCPDGRRFSARILGRAHRDEQGRIVALSGTLQDLSEHEDARARLEALADNLPSGAIYRLEGGLDHLRLSYISAGIENLIGVPARAIMADRQVYLNAIHPADLPLYQQMMQNSVDTLSVFDCRFRVLRPDGEIRWLRCRSAPRRCNEGMVWDGIMLDITREREAEQALRQAKEAAEAAERAKSDFLATMSHEIRTPMNTVIGMTRLVQQTALTSRQRGYLEKVERAANALLAVINDILDFSKIEAGMLVLEEVDFALDDVLETVSAATALRAEEKGLEVVYALDPGLPPRLRGDPLRLGQVLTNLVGNAIKFTEHGEVVVSIHLSPSPVDAEIGAETDALHARSHLCVSVRDTGIGLDASRAERLFQPFTQADTQTTRRHGGTGLGLAICHRLVQLMGGKIGVSSQPGQGSRFHFTARVAPAMDMPHDGHGTLDSRGVLIVDDNASAREALAAMVRKLGMRCDTAEDGAQALHMLEEALRHKSPYGLALLDWHMPGMDGLELARRMRKQQHLAATPAALMVTAFGRDEVQRDAAQLGLRGLLIKPLTASALLASIRETLQDPESPQPADPAAGLSPQQRYPGLPGRRVLVVDDNALNREVATELLEQAGMSVQTAADGLQALQRLDSQPFDAVLMDLHMPGMDGLSATRAIRSRSALRHLPVIALTALAYAEDSAQIAAAGVNAHLTKPVDDVLLYDTLQRCLSAQHPRSTVPAPTPAPRPTPPTAPTAPTPAPAWDPARLRQCLAGHSPRMLQVIEGFAHDFAEAPQKLREAVRHRDWEAVASLAHTFKGSLGYLGADLLVQWSTMAETGAHAARAGDGDGDGDGTNARPSTHMESLVQALADGLQGLLAEIAVLSGQGELPVLATVPIAPATPQRHPVNVDEVASTLARLRLQIADSDYAALAELDRLRPLVGERHGPMLQRIQRCTEYLETEAALQELDQLAHSLGQPTTAVLASSAQGSAQGAADA